MMDEFRLNNTCALVTGGSRGIGFGIAKALSKAGADIVLLARGEKKLERAREELVSTARKVWTCGFDMNRSGEIDQIYSKIVEETGGIDILVNNAGGTRRVPAEDISPEDWNFVINLNLSSVFAMCRAFARERIKTGKKGKIINIASLMSERVRANTAAYAASKGGIRQLTKALAVDWARYHINVNAIGPGYIQTELTKSLWQDADFNEWVKGRTPAGRWGLPEDIGSVAVFLASPASDFITGQILYVDGGFQSTL